MRDARLAELEFLSELNTKESLIIGFGNKEAHIGSQTIEKPYGLRMREFREMLFYLLIEGYLNGPAAFVFHPIDGGVLKSTHPEKEILSIYRGQSLEIKLNHKGRLRLWSLKDELLSKRKQDHMGILNSAEHLERDLEIAFLFLPPNQNLSLIFSDMDHFKQVNDNLSHEIGNDVMKRYLQLLRDTTSGLGEAYRGVGDEVTVILSGMEGEAAKKLAQLICDKVREEMAGLEILNTLEKRPTVSVGVTCFGKPTDPKKALRFVDKLMYRAKDGKDRIAFEEFKE